MSGPSSLLRLLRPKSNFGYFLVIAFGILAIAVVIEIFLSSSTSRPPDLEQALEDFTARYAEAAVNDIAITRDEVTSRSFEVKYRNKTTGSFGALEVHYANRGDGKWTIYPESPGQLP